jgi:hypothetical protein
MPLILGSNITQSYRLKKLMALNNFAALTVGIG